MGRGNIDFERIIRALNDVGYKGPLSVEWEDSAIEFLLSRGFDRNLGARPLKRAIERYLLSPLALTIVNHQFPDGDQFLFVRGDSNSSNAPGSSSADKAA